MHHPYLYSLLSSVEAVYFKKFCLSEFHDRFARVSVSRESPVVAIGAHAVHLPMGLALAEIRAEGEAQLLALWVQPKHRRQGIGTEMLRRLEDELRARNVWRLSVFYEKGQPYTEPVEAFLNACDFPPAETVAVSCRCLSDRMRHAPWIKKRDVPRAFAIFPWKDMTPEDRCSILARQASTSWFPKELDPFTTDSFEPLNSLGLRYRGEVVGWQINHRAAPDVIQYSITFVREDLQPFGLGVLLMTEATRLHFSDPAERDTKAFFRVPLKMQGMTAYIDNRLKPYVDDIRDCMQIRKDLTLT